MATTNILAAGTTEATSSTITLAEGEKAVILIKPAAGRRGLPLNCRLHIEHQNAAGAWVREPKGFNESTVLDAIGAYRVFRPAQTFAVGADRAE